MHYGPQGMLASGSSASFIARLQCGQLPVRFACPMQLSMRSAGGPVHSKSERGWRIFDSDAVRHQQQARPASCMGGQGTDP